jgi:hypothetical protein
MVSQTAKEGFHGCLPGAHFLAKYNQVADPLVQYVPIGSINPSCKKGGRQLDCIGEVICIGGSCHRRFTIFVGLFIVVSVGTSKSYAQKKKHKKHLMTK